MIDTNGIDRYEENKIITHLLDKAGPAYLNELWKLAWQWEFSRKEMRQFYKLIGISKCGYRDVWFDNIPNEVKETKVNINPEWQKIADQYPIAEYPKFWEKDWNEFDFGNIVEYVETHDFRQDEAQEFLNKFEIKKYL